MQKELEKRFPEFETTREATHKSACQDSDDTLTVYMPQGRRCYLWFTINTDTGKDAIYVVTKKPRFEAKEIFFLNTGNWVPLHYGTIVTAFQIAADIFVMTDLHYFRGVDVSTSICQKQKWACMAKCICPYYEMKLVLPQARLPSTIAPVGIPAYRVHHVQERKWCNVGAYINLQQQQAVSPSPSPSPSLQQNKHIKSFRMRADPKYDLYRLFDKNDKGDEIFVDYACVTDMETSKWLNSLFRIMKENENLDRIEESDDEEDFNDVDENKYTNLDAVYNIKCKFQTRLKKWIPIRGGLV
jgi:hypothetical protein